MTSRIYYPIVGMPTTLCTLLVDDIIILQVMNLIGDVKGKVAVMVDDMIDTAGELAAHKPKRHIFHS